MTSHTAPGTSMPQRRMASPLAIGVIWSIVVAALTLTPLSAFAGSLVLVSGNAPVGERDPHTEVSVDGGLTYGQAYVVNPQSVYDTITGSQWIKAGSDPETVLYRRTFQIPGGATDRSVTACVHADNAATIRVNGVQIGAQPQQEIFENFQDPAECYTPSADVLTSGSNLLEIDVWSGGPPSGLDYSVTVSWVESNLLRNGEFELDANGDNRPDGWTTNRHFTRSNSVVASGDFSGRHRTGDDASYTVRQAVPNLLAGTTYTFRGLVNIPATTEMGTFRIQVRWRNAAKRTIKAVTVETHTAPTRSWDVAARAMVAPRGTKTAVVRMVLRRVEGTIYVDQFEFSE
ncbi:MAG: hypothetical protein M3N24_10770 [Actinomycetota bacterium]|nr:hypothetical protein [Actinomycetota bacterium]